MDTARLEKELARRDLEQGLYANAGVQDIYSNPNPFTNEQQTQ
jgi:hypothetical protein